MKNQKTNHKPDTKPSNHVADGYGVGVAEARRCQGDKTGSPQGDEDLE